MNFLAHCLIPDRATRSTHPDLIAGGFLGDFVKGPVPQSLPAELATGIRLHRRIDAYSNRHPGIRTSCNRFPADLRRFAPVFVDVVADHLLARHWQRFHPRPLPEFTAVAYGAIQAHVDRLPAEGRRFFEFMRDEDLLACYRGRAAMERGLLSVTRRLGRQSSNGAVLAATEACLPGLEQDFLGYFPDMLSHAAGWLTREGRSARLSAGR